MTKKRLTYAERLQRRRDVSFVGRGEEREAFRRNFEAGGPECLIFAVHGQAGIGKSFLVERYREIARGNGAVTALTNEAEATAIRERSIVQAMGRLAEQLREADAPLVDFNLRYEKYRECIQKVEADEDAPPEVFDLLGRATVGLAREAIETTPAGKVGSKVLQRVGVDEGRVTGWAWTATKYLAKKFRNKHELVALVKEPVESLTPLFVKGLNELARRRVVVLCFDTWEWTGKHLDGWLRGVLKQEGLSEGVWLVIAGRNAPGDAWEPFHPVMACFELEVFTEAETRDYLRQQGVTERARVEQILKFSRGVPVLVSTLASAKGGSAAEAAEGLVDRYLKWVDDVRRREAALRCAAARRLNKDVVAAVMGGDDAGVLFDWLREMPFVQGRPGYWEYHPTVRKLMLGFARSRSVKESKRVHGRLRGYYRGLLAEKGDEAQYRDAAWRQHALEALYHGLMAEDGEAEREGLETFLVALRRYYALAGEVVVTWGQAAEEQAEDSAVMRWAKVLIGGWVGMATNSWAAVVPLYEALGKREDLSDAARCAMYFIGGLAHAGIGEHGRAIEDYGRAIAVDPKYATAYYNTACAYGLMGKAGEACEWLEKAIGLDEKYRGMARTDEDFDGIREEEGFRALVGKEREGE